MIRGARALVRSLALVTLVGACEDADVGRVDLGAVGDGATPMGDGGTDAMDAEPDARDLGPPVDEDTGADALVPPADVGPGVDAGPPMIEPPRPPTAAAPPEIPWAPSLDEPAVAPAAPPDLLLPCPTTWRAVAPRTGDDPVTTCDPWPASGAELACTAGSVHFPGDPGCSAVGRPCDGATFADPPAGATLVRYVRADAAAGGDGTMGSPFRTLAEALAGMGTTPVVVMLAAGTYTGALTRATGDLTIVGACSASVRIESGTSAPALTMTRGSTTLRNVTIAGIDANAGTLALDGVVVDGDGDGDPITVALRMTGGSLDATRLHVRGGQTGVVIRSDATATIDAAVIEGSVRGGVEVTGTGTSVALQRAWIHDTGGVGIGNGTSMTTTGGTVTLREVVLERPTEHGIHSFGATSVVDGEDVIVRDVRQVDGTEGFAINVRSNATFRLTRILIERASYYAVHGGSGTLELHGAVIRDTATRGDDGTEGVGVLAYYGNQATLDRVLVARARGAGIRVEHDATRLTMTDVAVQGVSPSSPDPAAPALLVRGGVVEGERVLLAGAVGRTLRVGPPAVATDAAPLVTLDHLIVLESGMAPGLGPSASVELGAGRTILDHGYVRSTGDGIAIVSDGIDGGEPLAATDVRVVGTSGTARTGIRTQDTGATATLVRVSVEVFETGIAARDASVLHATAFDATGVRWGLRARGRSMVMLERATIGEFEVAAILSASEAVITASDVLATAPTDGPGFASSIAAASGGGVFAGRVHVMDARGVGVGAFGFSSAVVLTDARIERTQPDVAGVCAAAGGYDDAVATVGTFAISDGASCCGVQIGAGGGADLETGTVEGHAVGACLDASYDARRVMSSVRYVDNELDVTTEPRPLPMGLDVGL